MPPLAQPAIECYEGEAFTETFTAKRAGVVVNLTGATITLSLWDEKASEGTLVISGSACSITDATNGIFTFPFTATHTTLVGRSATMQYIITVIIGAAIEKIVGSFVVRKLGTLA